MPILRTAVRIAEHVARGDLLYIADDDRRAASLAEAVRALSPAVTVVVVPATDALPGDDAPASPANAGQRVAALRHLHVHRTEPQGRLLCITSGEATAHLYPPSEAFDHAPPVIAPGAALDLETFEATCIQIGYVVDDRIDEPGEVAVRGAVVDLFPADAAQPIRIEVEDGVVTALRTYDPVSQRTLDDVPEIEIGRAAEPSTGDRVTLLEHLDAGSVVIEGRVAARRKSVVALAVDAARFGRGRAKIAEEDRWSKALGEWTLLDWGEDAAEPVPRFVERNAPLAAFARFAKPLVGEGVCVIVAGAERDVRFLRARVAKALGVDVVDLADWAEAQSLETGHLGVLCASADAGFRDGNVLVLAAADLLGSRAETTSASGTNGMAMLDGASEIRVGDVVVHQDHGIAIARGIEALPTVDAALEDAIVLEYAGEARRLVPVAEARKLWRYGADADAVTLDKLDGSSWIKRRATVDAAIAEAARTLTELAKARAARTFAKIEPDPSAYERFAAGFAFTETADQARAIAAVRADLGSGVPMDRLVIGDVGYGKTEVALRAAALVTLAGGQVAIAAPTTVLVRQHLEVFRRRFEGTGIVVEGLSRLSTAADKTRVKKGLADGSIGVVIGTAAVAGKGVTYKNLELVVIDEEQRFGATDKAKLRGLHDGHFLALSATPIPRTLQGALVGLQQMSVIATPPARRQPIRTLVEAWSDATARAALMRERARGGQSFVVVPRIEEMARLRGTLERLLPEAQIVEAHGKMPAADLDAAMIDFADGRGDILLATNIIEAGLDVPRANTMIVWRADRFGLSQLHQLRGRVGRGNRRGQILLLTDAEAKIAERTVKRLGTLAAFDRLGAGFAISARDMDARGGGDLTGDSQTGHMNLVGVDLYQHLLEAALRRANGAADDPPPPDLRLGLAGLLPEDWVPDVDLRLQLYVRLARITDQAGLDAFEEELEDRFGSLPDEAQALIARARVANLARSLAIARIDAGPAAIALTPLAEASVDFATAGFEGANDRYLHREAIEDPLGRLLRVEALLGSLAAE